SNMRIIVPLQISLHQRRIVPGGLLPIGDCVTPISLLIFPPAQIAMHRYRQEVHRQVDGVIVFTPFFIEHILQILGPLNIPGYNETITAQNLEDRLHYYQLDNAGIDKQLHMQGGDSSTSDRKRFTALVAHTLMDRIRHASVEDLLALAREIPRNLKTRDLQVYFTNSQLEDLLMQYGMAGQL